MGPSGPIFFCKVKGLSQFSFETAPFCNCHKYVTIVSVLQSRSVIIVMGISVFYADSREGVH